MRPGKVKRFWPRSHYSELHREAAWTLRIKLSHPRRGRAVSARRSLRDPGAAGRTCLEMLRSPALGGVHSRVPGGAPRGGCGPASRGTSGVCRGGRMTWLSQRKRPRRCRGAGEATERAVSAAAPRSQRLGPGSVRLSAPGGCESAAAAATEEEELVGARRMRPLPGAPGVAAAAALLLLLLPRARADEHEHTVRGVPAGRAVPGPLSGSPPRQGRRGLESPAALSSRAAIGGAFRLGLVEQEPRELGGGISLRSWDRTARPECLGLFPLAGPKWRPTSGSGGPRVRGKECGSARGSLRRGGGDCRHAKFGVSGPWEGSCALATGGYDAAEDGCCTITRHTQPGNILRCTVRTGLSSYPHPTPHRTKTLAWLQH